MTKIKIRLVTVVIVTTVVILMVVVINIMFVVIMFVVIMHLSTLQGVLEHRELCTNRTVPTPLQKSSGNC